MTLDAQTKPFFNALLIFFLAWAVIPPMTAPNPPLDSIEAFAWGANFELGYYKHPPLQAWQYGLVSHLGTGSWTFMWLSAAWIALAHICVWRAARHIVDPLTALWASALLQTIYFHNYFIPEFNPNIIQIAVFAAAGLFAIRAYKFGETRDWLALGAVIGVGMWAKYSVAVSAVTIALFFLADPIARRRLLAPGPYVGAALAILIFAPHAWWLVQQGGGAVTYVAGRAEAGGGLGQHAYYFAETFVNAALVLLFPALALWLGRDKSATPAEWPVADDASLRRLVLALAFGPILLAALFAVVAGFRIKLAWTSPFWTFAPLALLMLWRIDVRAKRWVRAGALTVFLGLFSLALYGGANLARPYVEHDVMRVHFPGPELARQVDYIWSQTFPDKPLRIVAGDTFIAGSAAYWSPSKPKVRTEDDAKKSPWAPDSLKREAGQIIVWDAAKQGDDLPAPLRATSPNAQVQGVLSLRYQTDAPVPPARIGVAIVPPADAAPQ